LNKICWFADTIGYRLNGVPITGETYVKRQRGPVPKNILKTIRELEDEKKIHVFEKAVGSHKMRLFVPLVTPDSSAFSHVEMDIINTVIADICINHTANSISDLSHDQIWDAANEGEEIPMFAVLASARGELTDRVVQWADAVVQRVESRKQVAA
jgi:hypothetical protein